MTPSYFANVLFERYCCSFTLCFVTMIPFTQHSMLLWLYSIEFKKDWTMKRNTWFKREHKLPRVNIENIDEDEWIQLLQDKFPWSWAFWASFAKDWKLVKVRTVKVSWMTIYTFLWFWGENYALTNLCSSSHWFSNKIMFF